MSAPAARAFVFQCSGNTYMECIEKSVVGSNDPWPLQVKKGDLCLLNHYEYDSLLALGQAASDGGKKLVPKAWGGKLPFHVRIALVTPSIVELPKGALGSQERVLEGERAVQILDLARSKAPFGERRP